MLFSFFFMTAQEMLSQQLLPWVSVECSGLIPECNVVFCKLYQHLLQDFFSASAHCSWSHSSYTPYCLHLMPPICPEPKMYCVREAVNTLFIYFFKNSIRVVILQKKKELLFVTGLGVNQSISYINK